MVLTAGLAVLLGAVLAPVAAFADAASPWFATEQGKVRLIAAQPGVDGAAALSLGLQFELAPHWKIYWRSPGDAGYPPQLDWKASQNLAATEIAWPAPERFSVLGLETVGYSGAVVLPITARLQHPGAPVHLAAHLSYLICSDICVPNETNLALDLPAQASGSGYGALIDQYRALVPGDGKAVGLALQTAVLRAGPAPVLELGVKSSAPLVAPDVFIEGAQDAVFGAPQVIATEGDITRLRLPVSGAAAALPGHSLEVTLVDGARAMTGRIVPVAGADVADATTLLTMLGFALLGGLILNLMPCVLPVLSLKLLAAFPKDGHTVAGVRRGFIASAAGIIVSFLVLGGATASLKAAGVAIGWGMQFQSATFLVFLVAVLTLFAANLWGFFEVPLPRAVAAIGERAALGSFATGAFATLLAIPCSAPFLGAALGFALTQGAGEIIGIFAAIGLGMAAPYLLVAGMPRLALLLPRPGRWMIQLRRILGVLLAATAVWLLSVLADDIGERSAAVVALLMLAVIAAFAFLHEPGPRRATLAIAFIAAFLVPRLAPAPARIALGPNGLWQKFDPEAISGLVRGGHIVFVDVTAAWCLTCKVNERLVLDDAAVRAALTRPGVVAMRADWTRPNPAIAAYLSRFGRYGIPFNSVYGPAAPSGVALPELLTQGAVTTALAEAEGR